MIFLSALMTRRLICTCAVAISALAPASHVFAQRAILLVKVPFPFQDGSHLFPAGEYLIKPSEHSLLLRNSQHDQIGIVGAVGELRPHASRSAKVVFRKYGDQYFLSDVWLADSTSGYQLIVSRAEKALRRALAKRASPPTDQVALNVTQP